MKKAVIVLPTYNEKGNIGRLIAILQDEIFPNVQHWKMAILVVDDMSPDGTGDVVRNLMKKYNNIALSEGQKHGLGAAYVRGMTYAVEKMGADVLFSMDSDLQHDPYKVPQFLKKLDEGYDMVVGTRYSGGGSIPKSWPFLRKAYSRVANLFVRMVFTRFYLHDWTEGYRALKKEVFLEEKKELKNFRGYIFQISFLYKAVRDNFRVAEVPFHFSDRTEGSSKIASFSYILDVVKYVILTRIYELKRFVKFLFVGGTGFIIQLIAQEVSVYCGISNPNSVAIGAEMAILPNFLFNNFWTFGDTRHIKEKGNFFKRLIKFNLVSFGAILIQYLADFFAELAFGHTLYLFGFAAPTRILILFPTIIFIVIPLNYFIYNKVIWKTHYLKKSKT